MIVLNSQTPDGRGHPTILVAMIVDAAVLANFPADRHALKQIVLENQIAGVVAFRKIAVFVQSLRKDGVADDVVLNILQCKFSDWNTSEPLNPICDCELFDSDVSCHGKPPIRVHPLSGRQSNPAEAGIAKEL
jgi:hypothetical protein